MNNKKKEYDLKFKLNIQHFAAEPGLTDTEALGESISIDFTSRFGSNLKKFMEALSITRRLPMGVGTALHKYAMDVDGSQNNDGVVAEGDIIPLTKVTRRKIDIIELDFKKYRKSTPVEAIQAHGYDLAVTQTNDAFLKYIQNNIKNAFYADLMASAEHADRTNNEVVESKNLQGVLAFLRANLETVADDDVTMLALVNPKDAAQHLADGTLNSLGAIFGMNILQDYTGTVVMTNSVVPQGKVFATVAENIVVPYVDVAGETSQAFDFTKDELGFIGVLNDLEPKRLTADTIAMHGIKLFADNVDLVKVGAIVPEVAGTPEGA